jgi:hypothetical protein
MFLRTFGSRRPQTIAEAAAQQNQPKQVMHTASYYSPYIPEYVVTILQFLLLRQANLRHLGNSLHLHHQCNLHIPRASSHKGASTLTSSETSGNSPKLAQSTVLCQNRSTSTRRYPTSKTVFAFTIIFFLIRNNH